MIGANDSMRFLKITLAYDGANYVGWQAQPNGRSVQETLEEAILKVTGETIRVVASGRTDSGVHALAQVVSLRTDSTLPADVLRRALHANTPEDIAVLSVSDATEGFHAIRDCLGKRYRYAIQDSPTRDIFSRHYTWHVPQRLDVEAMNLAAQALLGEHDFTSFEAAGSPRATSVRTIREIAVQRERRDDAGHIILEVEADGFLYNMVRNIVGTLVEVGRGRQGVDWPARVLSAKDRKVAAATAPPHGLFLLRVDYNE